MEKKFIGFSWSLVVLGLIMVFVTRPKSVDAITCQEALTDIMPCEDYLTGGATDPPVSCCAAVATVNAAATTTAIRRDLCRCFEKAGPAAGVLPDKAKALPQKCGITVAVPIDPTINCDTIK